MRLQKHKTRKDKDYYKYVVVIPQEDVENAQFKEGEELKVISKKGLIKLEKK